MTKREKIYFNRKRGKNNPIKYWFMHLNKVGFPKAKLVMAPIPLSEELLTNWSEATYQLLSR